jgi:hypothetical protein
MAQLTKEDFEAKYTGTAGAGALFKDNITRDIVASRIREFADDIADSFLLNNSGEVESWKEPCRVATTANITLSGTQTIDTVSCSNGDRILVLNQTDAKENGIYVMASGAWSRSTDADLGSELDGAAVAVQEGATYFSKIFLQTTTSVTIGVSNIVWVVYGTSSGISGLTTNRIPYATSPTTLGDGPTWDSPNQALTVFQIRLHSRGGATNVFLGGSAGNFTLTGIRNIGIGNQALFVLTSGTDNVAIGYLALGQNTSGAGNVGIGSSALAAMQTGQANIGIGPSALLANTAGLSNIALGSAALSQCTGDRNIAFGENAGDNITTADRCVMIGYNIDSQSPIDDGQLSIQNIIFGVSNTGTGTTPSTGAIGIGEPTPTRKLEVAGSLAIKAGTSIGNIARVPGVIHTNITTAGNVGTGEDTLFTYTIPANVLSTDKDTIRATFTGTFAATANDKRIRVKFGATTIVDTTDASTQAGNWRAEVEIVRTGATTQKCSGFFVSSIGTNNPTYYAAAAETLSGTVALVVTAEATATDDAVFQMGKVRWEPAE